MVDNVSVYLRLNEKDFDSTKQQARRNSIDEDPNDSSSKEDLLYTEAKIKDVEFELQGKTDELSICGALFSPAQEIGWVDFKVPLSSELMAEIIERYMKKLGKLKTVLEATK